MKNIFLILCFAFSSVVSAQEDNRILVDPNDLPPAVLAEIKAKQKVEGVRATINEVASYSGWGKEVGIAINDGLGAVTKSTAEFAETDVGKFTMFMIAYKIVGKDFVAILIVLPISVSLLVFVGISYWKSCVPRRMLVSKGDKDIPAVYKVVNQVGGSRYDDYAFSTEHYWGRFLTHALIAALICVGTLITLFA
jgi:hypothetical protein